MKGKWAKWPPGYYGLLFVDQVFQVVHDTLQDYFNYHIGDNGDTSPTLETGALFYLLTKRFQGFPDPSETVKVAPLFRLSTLMAKIISFLFGETVHIHMLRWEALSSAVRRTSIWLETSWSFLSICSVTYHYEKSTAKVLDQTVERFATICNFFLGAIYDSEIVIISGNFYFPNQCNSKFPFIVVYTTIRFARFLTVCHVRYQWPIEPPHKNEARITISLTKFSITSTSWKWRP